MIELTNIQIERAIKAKELYCVPATIYFDSLPGYYFLISKDFTHCCNRWWVLGYDVRLATFISLDILPQDIQDILKQYVYENYARHDIQ